MGDCVLHALATLGGLGDYSGNSTSGQQPNSSGDQETEQDQASGTGAQSKSQEFNALTGNNFNLNGQQNGEWSSPLTALEESPSDSTTAIQNSSSQ